MTAYEERLQTISVIANADLSAQQYRFIRINSSGKAAVVTVAAGRADGVLQDAPAAANRAGEMAYAGVSKVRCGGTITAGAQVTSDASGNAVAVTSGDKYSHGVAMEAGSSGIIIPVMLKLNTGAPFSDLS